MKILLTGCDGQVGKLLQQKLESEMILEALNKDQLDISNLENVTKVVSGIRPDIIINAAAYTAVDAAEDNQDLAFSVNKEGPQNLAFAAEMQNALLIHFSTDYVFDGESNFAYCETDEVSPKGVYGKSKLAGEQAIVSTCTKYIILRTAWVFSEYGDNFVKTMLRLGADYKSLGIVNDQVGGPTYAGDIAEIVEIICEKVSQCQTINWGVYNYSGSPYVSWYEFASSIFLLAKNKGILSNIPELRPLLTSEYPTKAQRPLNSRLNCDKIIKEFDIGPSDWQIGLEKMLTMTEIYK